MRRVIDSREVYHLWAHQSQDSARGHASISFEGERAYSYSAVIGRILTSPKTGERVYLLSSRSYSVTTSRHQSMLRSACYGLGTRFSVYDPSDSPERILRSMLEELPALAEKVAKARTRKDWAQSTLDSRINDCREFARLFKLSTKGIPASGDAAEINARAEKVRKAEEAATKKRNREAIKESLAALPAWFAGEHPTGLRFSVLDTDYLRVRGDHAETSKGAYVPIEHVKQVAPLVLSILREKRTYKRNGHSIHLGHYTLDSIDKDGTVKVGCHTFKRAEIERFAETI